MLSASVALRATDILPVPKFYTDNRETPQEPNADSKTNTPQKHGNQVDAVNRLMVFSAAPDERTKVAQHRTEAAKSMVCGEGRPVGAELKEVWTRALK